jgi:hypothetical protein
MSFNLSLSPSSHINWNFSFNISYAFLICFIRATCSVHLAFLHVINKRYMWKQWALRNLLLYAILFSVHVLDYFQSIKMGLKNCNELLLTQRVHYFLIRLLSSSWSPTYYRSPNSLQCKHQGSSNGVSDHLFTSL